MKNFEICNHEFLKKHGDPVSKNLSQSNLGVEILSGYQSTPKLYDTKMSWTSELKIHGEQLPFSVFASEGIFFSWKQEGR